MGRDEGKSRSRVPVDALGKLRSRERTPLRVVTNNTAISGEYGVRRSDALHESRRMRRRVAIDAGARLHGRVFAAESLHGARTVRSVTGRASRTRVGAATGEARSMIELCDIQEGLRLTVAICTGALHAPCVGIPVAGGAILRKAGEAWLAGREHGGVGLGVTLGALQGDVNALEQEAQLPVIKALDLRHSRETEGPCAGDFDLRTVVLDVAPRAVQRLLDLERAVQAALLLEGLAYEGVTVEAGAAHGLREAPVALVATLAAGELLQLRVHRRELAWRSAPRVEQEKRHHQRQGKQRQHPFQGDALHGLPPVMSAKRKAL